MNVCNYYTDPLTTVLQTSNVTTTPTAATTTVKVKATVTSL